MMIVGILALQGAFAEHMRVFNNIGVKAVEIRLPSQLKQVDGLVIPGGESTTIMKLLHDYELAAPIREMAKIHMPLWGTCAGMICLANKAFNPDSSTLSTLGLMDITVFRNAFGRQVDSFEIPLQINGLGVDPFPGVFIRAPYIHDTGKEVQALSVLHDGEIVAARQGHMLATSFHPELTGDNRLHKYFATMLNRRP